MRDKLPRLISKYRIGTVDGARRLVGIPLLKGYAQRDKASARSEFLISEVFHDHKRVAAAIAAVVDAVGQQDFYAIVLETLRQYIDCERWLVIKYSRFSAPSLLSTPL